MSYVSRPVGVWHSLPGVVAAYQPVAAPGPLIARYNQAHGGDNRYKATGVDPTWHGATGWSFNGTTQYLGTKFLPTNDQSTTLIIAVIRTGSEANGAFGGIYNLDSRLLGFFHNDTSTYFPANGGYYWNLSRSAATLTVLAISGNRSYTNGVDDGITIGGGSGAFVAPAGVGIGAVANSTSATRFKGCMVRAFAIYQRRLAASEVWCASRQMAYCHVNPDWSAWGVRRRWYYAPSAAVVGRVGFGRGPGLGGSDGVRIEGIQ